MKIRIGEVFRVSRVRDVAPAPGGTRSYLDLTRGSHGTSADVNKGIWAYKDISEVGEDRPRTPAVLLHSNPFKEGSDVSPWIDVVEPDLGYAFYNGDNRSSGRPPAEAPGNALLFRLQSMYTDPARRKYAPPVLLFTQEQAAGRRKGYRSFSGYGIPTRYMVVSQRERGTNRYFTNLAVELSLFRLEAEDEKFDWGWIDKRRDAVLTADAVLRSAPLAWRTWVVEGEPAIEKCRRRVARHRVVSKESQLDFPEGDRALLEEVAARFSDDPHAFEGLASLVAQRVIGHGCRRAWVTRRSADGGVDFVCRLDVGSEFSRMAAVVLGQAKCVAPASSVSGRDLARLVARLQRGWFGVFVTTGVFSPATQQELYEDRYPVVLINGKRLARELRTLLVFEGASLLDLLERERRWYELNLRSLDPTRALDDLMFNQQLTVGPEAGAGL